MYAAKLNSIALIKLLLQYSADLFATDSVSPLPTHPSPSRFLPLHPLVSLSLSLSLPPPLSLPPSLPPTMLKLMWGLC